MRPVSVRFQCFGPYMAEQFIDFTELEKNGLFLICGETGAGKTTILDAMCYALYGKSSGGLRGDISVMRCKLAGKNDETLVEFVFESDGNRYRFLRSLKYGRKKLNDFHDCQIWQEDRYVPIFENPKATVVNQKARELIGLTYEQFCQVIILPQGQFEKLLTSNSEDKEKILVSLFHADRWQRITDEIARRVAERDAALKQERFRINARLRDYDCDDLAQLAAKIGETAAALEVLRNGVSAAEQAVSGQKKRYEEALLENQAFEELRRRERQLSRLLPRSAEFDREERLLELADKADALMPQFRSWQESGEQKTRWESRTKEAEQVWSEACENLSRVQQEKQRHEDARPEYEQGKQRLTLLGSSRTLYQTLAEKKKEAERACQAERCAAEQASSAKTEFDRCHTQWQQAVLEQSKAMEDYRNANTVYLRGIGSTLAQKLLSGEPCPVCGSREHPHPASPGAEHMTDAQLDEFNKAMNHANDRVSEAMSSRTQSETQWNRAREESTAAAQRAAVAQADYDGALAQRIPGIDTLDRLEEAITQLRQVLEAFEREEQTTLQALTEAEGNLKAAQAQLENARKELSAAESHYAAQLAVWEEALLGSGLENEQQFRASTMDAAQRQRRQTALIQFRTDVNHAQTALAEQQTLLEGRDAPDMEAMKEELDALEAQQKQVQRQLTLQEQHLSTMEQDAKTLTQQSESYEQARIAVDADLEFATRLRGRSGLSLQRYVLGVMLTSITVEANRLLKNVYGGRYQLFRTNEIAGSGHKGGLELEVYDAANNERRSVTTLSGGEKFLVALSLAIGLSTVVQAQGSGIRLEAMFVDEGFGSLDREAVNDALEVLQGIQRSSGIVGIISHVEQLSETIPTRLEIRKGENGSTCVLKG